MTDKMPSAWENYVRSGHTVQPWPDEDDMARAMPLPKRELLTAPEQKKKVFKQRRGFGKINKDVRRPRIAVSQWASDNYHDILRQLGADVYEVSGQTLLKDFDKCEGLIIPGGRDVAPSWYDQSFHNQTQMPDMDRDAIEMAFIQRAIKNNMRVLGVCRGHQLLNVALGGTLNQHINNHITHKHPVDIMPDSKNFAFIGEDFWVNSLHHQSIDRLGRGLRVAARAHDGTIEAIEHVEHPFVVGVQWHPEMNLTPRFEREMDHLLDTFIQGKARK